MNFNLEMIWCTAIHRCWLTLYYQAFKTDTPSITQWYENSFYFQIKWYYLFLLLSVKFQIPIISINIWNDRHIQISAYRLHYMLFFAYHIEQCKDFIKLQNYKHHNYFFQKKFNIIYITWNKQIYNHTILLTKIRKIYIF